MRTVAKGSKRALLTKVLKRVSESLKVCDRIVVESRDDRVDVSLVDDNVLIRKTPFSGPDCDAVAKDFDEIIKRRIQIIEKKTEEESSLPPEPGRSLLKRKAEALEKDPTCPIYGYATFTRIFSLGRARGKPCSQERIVQLEKLWIENISELHTTIPHSEETHEKWVEQFATLSQGQSYFLKVLGGLPRPEYMRTLAHVCNSSGRHKKRFDGITDNIDLRSGLWVPRGLIQAYRADLSPYVNTKDLQGFPIEIKPTGGVKIKWLASGGLKRTLTLNISTCAVLKLAFNLAR